MESRCENIQKTESGSYCTILDNESPGGGGGGGGGRGALAGQLCTDA